MTTITTPSSLALVPSLETAWQDVDSSFCFAMTRTPGLPQRWPASATMMRRAGELPRVLAKHLLDGSDPGRQTEALISRPFDRVGIGVA
jgi:hypothetical protein